MEEQKERHTPSVNLLVAPAGAALELARGVHAWVGTATKAQVGVGKDLEEWKISDSQ